MNYEILATGSSGNAVILNDFLLIDCGVPWSRLKDYAGKLQLVLLTHWHGDHLKIGTLERLVRVRPSIRIACCDWLEDRLKTVRKRVDVLSPGRMYGYGICTVEPVPLKHDVPNCGWKIIMPNMKKCLYATDTGSMDGVKAKNYDLYLLEANYYEDEIAERIADKQADGKYAYERRVLETHLSCEQAAEWIRANAGPKSEWVQMHRHEE